MEKLKNTKILGIIGNVLLIIAVFLPIYSVSILGYTQSVSYIQGDGVIVLILAIVNLVLIFADKIGEKVEFFKKLTNPKFTLIPTAIIAIMLIMLSTSFSSSGLSSLGSMGGLSIGFWLLWVGVVVAAIYPFLYKGEDSAK